MGHRRKSADGICTFVYRALGGGAGMIYKGLKERRILSCNEVASVCRITPHVLAKILAPKNLLQHLRHLRQPVYMIGTSTDKAFVNEATFFFAFLTKGRGMVSTYGQVRLLCGIMLFRFVWLIRPSPFASRRICQCREVR
jgi:hypothetical protein